METVRTPEERFQNLPGYPFEPNYVEIADGEGGTLRVHYLDEGPRDGEVVLCMHGQPSWSFLYRKMIPYLTGAGVRVLAPDLVGFGRSDKPTSRDSYTYARHVGWMSDWFEQMNVSGVTLVCQDWGGLIGLRVATAYPDKFARIVVANTGLPDGAGIPEEVGQQMKDIYEQIEVISPEELPAKFMASDGPPGFFYWRKMCAEYSGFHPKLIMGGALAPWPEDVQAGYAAPFPDDEQYIAGARQFPSLVPIFPDDPEIPKNRKAWDVLRAWEKPFLTAFSDMDPVTAGGEVRFQEEVPGAKGQAHVTIKGGGHFLQEDKPQELAEAVIAFIKANPAG